MGLRIGLGDGAVTPFPSPSLFPLRKKGKGGRLGLGVLVGFPPLGAPPLGRPPPPPLLYIRGQGPPLGDTTIDH